MANFKGDLIKLGKEVIDGANRTIYYYPNNQKKYYFRHNGSNAIPVVVSEPNLKSKIERILF